MSTRTDDTYKQDEILTPDEELIETEQPQEELVEDIDENVDVNDNDNDNVNEDIDDNENENEDEDGKTTRSRRRLMASLLNDTDINATNLRELLRSIEFNGELFRRNLKFFFVVLLCLLAFVTNRYQAQQEIIEEANLKTELEEMTYTWLTRFSELTTASRQSQIEERLKQLGDSTLQHSKEAPIIIKADK